MTKISKNEHPIQEVLGSKNAEMQNLISQFFDKHQLEDVVKHNNYLLENYLEDEELLPNHIQNVVSLVSDVNLLFIELQKSLQQNPKSECHERVD